MRRADHAVSEDPAAGRFVPPPRRACRRCPPAAKNARRARPTQAVWHASANPSPACSAAPTSYRRRSSAAGVAAESSRRDGPSPRIDDVAVGALQHQMGIGAAGAEGTHTGATNAARKRPTGCDGHRSVGTRLRVALGKMHLRRQDAGIQASHRLDHSGDAGGSLGVANRGLHRPHQQRSVPAGEHIRQRIKFDRIAQRRAGSVRLDEVDRVGRQAGSPPAHRGSPPPGRSRWAR